MNHKCLQRLIEEMGLQVHTKKLRKYRSYKGEQGKIAPNLLQRDFSASKPNEKWLTDITEFSVKDEKCSFSPILDCFNNERIAYGLSRRPSARNAITSGGKITENYEFDITFRPRNPLSNAELPTPISEK
ncbi:hypothetical protein [Haemophilus parahaemolyticus]|uniref:hypothetical protein n=1 Tax=Haemophilus parahaemolyticus TaxID=735 RepID=UPI001E383BF9|nr:hypothetical protein [Haemophilus parahaemolyticus]